MINETKKSANWPNNDLQILHRKRVILKSARDCPGTGNDACRTGILFKTNFCRNYIQVYNCFT